MAKRKTAVAVRPLGCAVLVLFVPLLWMACLLLAAVVLKPREEQAAVRSWPAIPCLIQELRVHSTTTQSRGRKPSTSYAPQVKFTYDFNGQSYTSNRFWLGATLFNSRKEVLAIIAPYQAGTAAVCYVNPQAPHEAVLSRQLYDEGWLGWLWLILFGLVGAVGCAVALWLLYFPRGLRNHSSWVPATRGEVVVGWLVALAWNAVFGTLFVQVWLRGAPWSSLLELFGFPFLGALLLAGASLKTWQYWQAAGRA